MVDPAVDFLADPRRGRARARVGIGTGRIALPLAAAASRGGIELSEAMTAQLRRKPGSGDIPVAIGDFATTRVDGTFRLVYLVFNTIGNLTTQDQQVACFGNAAAHLEPGGTFVVEVGVPRLQWLPPGETVIPFHVSDDRIGFDEYDVANQGLISHHLEIARRARDPRFDPVPLRLAGRVRPDGAARRHAPAGALQRLAARAVHQHQPQARLGVEE